jgi:release factor glutamine methyltransferase
MNVDAWLREAEAKLTRAGISTARLDTLVLLEDLLDHERSWLLANPDFELTSAQTATLQKLLTRRTRHEPLAYIRGKTEFYGRTFILSSAVLEPRPESETIIDQLKELVLEARMTSNTFDSGTKSLLDVLQSGSKLRIADVGCGSGALGITAALELKNASIDLLDIDENALKIAQMNVVLHTTGSRVVHSDLLANSAQDYHILLCNLPYVPDAHTINQAAMHEPKLAIFGGPDGLDLYRKMYKQIMNMQKRPLFILCESLPPQHTALKNIAERAGYELTNTADFIQLFTRRTVPG